MILSDSGDDAVFPERSVSPSLMSETHVGVLTWAAERHRSGPQAGQKRRSRKAT
jgi:hypothetical protein